MAKDASHFGGNRGGRRVTREVGQRGNTRPREDKSVRRARRLETDRRLLRARDEQEAAEASLRALEAQSTVITVEGSTMPDLAKEFDKPAVEAPKTRGSLDDARSLFRQGYSLARVVEKTGWPEEHFKSMAGPDGYCKLSRIDYIGGRK